MITTAPVCPRGADICSGGQSVDAVLSTVERRPELDGQVGELRNFVGSTDPCVTELRPAGFM